MEEREEDREEDGEEDFEEDLEAQRPRAGDRVIMHLDLDCFYAQVETLRNPQLRGKPVGVQQKSLVVTCNYEARKFGIGKCMDVRSAKEKCPQLILVNGEDLNPYREMSYKVTEFLGEFCPLVERLGLDENFLDLTELVGKRFQRLGSDSQIQVCGHVYNQQALNPHNPRHLQLLLGSQISQEFRESLKSKLGITGCAGIASNKVLAKLVSGTFKPDQQTVLLPESHQDLLEHLENLQRIPGIGSQTSRKLGMLGIHTVKELQDFPAVLLEKEFGATKAQKLQKLLQGQDESPVIPWGLPKSLSDEDSFPSCSSPAQALHKLRELLPNLLSRISKDGRHPHTIKLSIRRFALGNRRECRQCPIPAHLIPKFGKAENLDLIPPLLAILLQLLGKMIPLEFPFHLTLLSISFSNLKAIPSGKESLDSYLETPGKHPREWDGNGNSPPKSRKIPEGKTPLAPPPALPKENPSGIPFPPDVDPKVFQELPQDVQKELVAEWNSRKNLEKPPGKAPKGRNSGMFSRSNSLLRYFKAK